MAKEEIFFGVTVDTKQPIKTLGALKKEIKSINKELNDTPKGSKRFDELSKSLSTSKGKLRDFNREINKSKSLTQTIGDSFKRMGTLIAGAFAGRAIIQGIGKTIGIIKDFDQSAANLASVLGKTQKEIVALTKDAKRLGSVTAFTASEVSQLQVEFAKLGFNEQEILDATEATLSLAAATGSELSEAAAVAGATLGGFGLKAHETQRVVDVMAKSFSLSALDMEKFKESMKTAAPAARAVGVSVEETTALLGTMSKAGISGSRAGNALKNTFIELNKKGLTLEEGLNKVKNSQDKLGTATKLVGKIAATSFLTLAEGTEITKELTEGLNNAGGAAEKMAKTQLDTLEGKTKLLTSAWEGFVLSLDSGDGAISRITAGILELTTSMLNMLTPGESLTDQFIKQRDEFELMEKSMPRLLDRYDGLSRKTKKTAEEQEELKNIIAQVSKEFPLSTTAINKHGEAVEINTERTRKMIAGQKAFNKELQTKAIEETEEAISDMAESLADLDKNHRRNSEGLLMFHNILTRADRVAGMQEWTVATEEQTLAYQDGHASLQKRIVASNELLFVIRNGKKIIDDEQKETKETLELEEKRITTIKTLTAESARLTKLRDETSETDTTKITNLNLEIRAINAKVTALKRLHSLNIDALQTDLKKLEHDDSALAAFKADAKETMAIEESIEDQRNQHLKNSKGRTEEEELFRQKTIAGTADLFKSLSALAGDNEKLSKAFAITSVLIDTARAVASSLKLPPPLNFIQAAAVGAAGAVQISNIRKAEDGMVLPKFADGGILDGASHANGGIPIRIGGKGFVEAEGGEPILSKGVSQNPNLLAAASRINVLGGGKPLYQDGGILPDFGQETTSGNEDIISALENMPAPIVSVVEIQDAAASVTIAEQQATI